MHLSFHFVVFFVLYCIVLCMCFSSMLVACWALCYLFSINNLVYFCVYYFYTHVSVDYVACKWRYPPFATLILNIK